MAWPVSAAVVLGEFAIGREECDPFGDLTLRSPDGLGGLLAVDDVTGSDVYTDEDGTTEIPYEGEISLQFNQNNADELILSAQAAGEGAQVNATSLIRWSWSDATGKLTASVVVPFSSGSFVGASTFNFSAA